MELTGLGLSCQDVRLDQGKDGPEKCEGLQTGRELAEKGSPPEGKSLGVELERWVFESSGWFLQLCGQVRVSRSLEAEGCCMRVLGEGAMWGELGTASPVVHPLVMGLWREPNSSPPLLCPDAGSRVPGPPYYRLRLKVQNRIPTLLIC